MKKITALKRSAFVILMSCVVAMSGIAPISTARAAENSNIQNTDVSNSARTEELSIEEQKKRAYVDYTSAENMSTGELVRTVLDYPFIVDVYAYGIIDQGIDVVREQFPPLDVLLERDDALNGIASWKSTYFLRDLKMYISGHLVDYINEHNRYVLNGLINPVTGRIEDTVYTPNGSMVFVYRDLTWSNFNKNYDEALQESQAMAHQYKATLIRNPNPKYNCHSYAWYSTSSSNPYWMNNPSKYIVDGSYISSNGSISDKVTYKNSYGYSHSGIVTGYNEITSKWGAAGLYRHTVDNCPYHLGATVEYWRRR